jgi:hypothetical protein
MTSTTRLPDASTLRLAMLRTKSSVDHRVTRLYRATKDLYELSGGDSPQDVRTKLIAEIDDALPELPGIGAAVAAYVSAWLALQWSCDVMVPTPGALSRAVRDAGEAYDAITQPPVATT